VVTANQLITCIQTFGRLNYDSQIGLQLVVNLKSWWEKVGKSWARARLAPAT
jgi:hypothetical protein